MPLLDPDRILSTFPTSLLNLTHLQVPRIYITKGQAIERNLVFPYLHTLHIDLSAEIMYRGQAQNPHRYLAPGSSLDCLNWSLPSLVNLGFWGVNTVGYKTRDIEDITKRFGSNLQGLSLTAYSITYAKTLPTPLPSGLWNYCPKLKTLHTFLTNITSLSRPPPTHPPLRFIACHIADPEYWRNAFGIWRWYHHDISLFKFLILSWKIDPFEIETSWSELEQRLEEFDVDNLKLLYTVFDQINQAGLCFKDRYGEGVDSDAGNTFMSSLKRYATSAKAKSIPFSNSSSSHEEGSFEEPEAEFTDSEGSDTSMEGDDPSRPLEKVDYSYFLENEFLENWDAANDDEDEDYCPEDELGIASG
jgi:hypothetical protein